MKYFDVHSMGSKMVLAMIYKQTAAIKGAQILAFQPPMVQGFSATNGLTFSMLDRTGGDVNNFFKITQNFLAELNQRPEIGTAMTSYNSQYPQYMIDVNVAKCKQSGIDPSTVLTAMQGYYGGLYASNFNSFGKLYRVMIQADPKMREDLKSMNNVYVRTANGMARFTVRRKSPVSTFSPLLMSTLPLPTATLQVTLSVQSRKWQAPRCPQVSVTSSQV